MASNELTRRRTPVAGGLDPVQAYARLRRFQPLLLDGLGAHPEARYAFIALGGVLDVAVHGDEIQLTAAEGHTPPALTGDTVPARLQELFDAYRFDVDEPEGFTGGWVGYFGYEALHWFEPSLAVHPSRTPEARLRLCRDVLAIDRRDETAWLWTTDLPGEQDADGRRDEYLEALGHASKIAPVQPFDATWQTSLDQPTFEAAVVDLKRRIAEGDHFQTNLATRFTTDCDLDPLQVFSELAAANPSPFMALLEWPDHAIISSSPEQLFSLHDGVIRSRPIAGTRPRGSDHDEDLRLEQELLADPKEQAEHTMLVDLVRNDVAKVAVPGTVHVPERMSIERYRHVMHLVSRVQAEVRPGTGFMDWLAALFPGGTITGAPKHRACMRIHDHEPVARGAYTGSAGFLSWSHNAHWNILIRTLTLADGQAMVHAGSGIVADSDPSREWHEAGHKARAMLQAALGRSSGGNMDRLGEVTTHGEWRPPRPTTTTAARVLLVDNYDSFTYNLADYCAALGATVHVVRNDTDAEQALAWQPTHIILGPGPGRPEESGASIPLAQTDLPTLGICLGHQVMGQLAGADIITVPPVHGKTSDVHHDGGFLEGLPSPFVAARYHSLAVDAGGLPDDWRPIAWSGETLMAMQHRERPYIGLQFHPESICTDTGLEIVRRFLER